MDTAIGTAIDTAIGTAIDTAIDIAIDIAIDTAIDTAMDTAIDTAIGTEYVEQQFITSTPTYPTAPKNQTNIYVGQFYRERDPSTPKNNKLRT
ncbi:hypothetical protein BgiMline_027601 [Biomphalaria glabrata]